jgi:hypothetical protein
MEKIKTVNFGQWLYANKKGKMKHEQLAKTNRVACSYCGEKVAIYFAAYGKHSCSNPVCRVQHEADGVAYCLSLGLPTTSFNADIPQHPPIKPKKVYLAPEEMDLPPHRRD